MNINEIYQVVVQAQLWTTMNTGDNHELKFGYSEKAIKFEKIFHLKFDIIE